MKEVVSYSFEHISLSSFLKFLTNLRSIHLVKYPCRRITGYFSRWQRALDDRSCRQKLSMVRILVTLGDLVQLFRRYRHEYVHNHRIDMTATKTPDLCCRLLVRHG